MKRTSPAIGFLFFYFSSEYLKQLQSSEPLHAKRPLILLLVRITVCMSSNRDLFRRTELQKCGRDINCPLGCGSKVENYIIPQSKPKKKLHFGGFSHPITVRQPIGRQDTMQTVIRTSRRLGSVLHEAAQNFEVVSNIQE